MPGTTTNRGYRTPAGGDAFLGAAAQVALMGADIDADVASLAPIIRQVQRTGTGPSIPDNTATTIVGFNTTTISVGTPVPAYASGAFTIPVAGVWEARIFARWPAISAAHRTVLSLLQNGTNLLDGVDTKWYPSGTSVWTYHGVTAYAVCAVGDTISQQVFQDSGAAQTLVTDTPVFSIRRIG